MGSDRDARFIHRKIIRVSYTEYGRRPLLMAAKGGILVARMTVV
jgi:hypothetical protein